MLWPLFLALSTLLSAMQYHWSQAEFDEAVQNRFLIKARRILIDNRDRSIDPSASENAALYAAVRQGDVDILKLILADGRVDPAEADSHALHLAAEGLHLNAVMVLLRDGRSSVGFLYEAPWTNFLLKPQFNTRIRGISRSLMEASCTGELKCLCSEDFNVLDLMNIDLLLERARNQPHIRRLLYRRQLELLGSPACIFEDMQLHMLLADINPVHPVLTKRWCRSFLRLAMIFRPLRLPREIIFRLNEALFQDFHDVNLPPIEYVDPIASLGKISYPVPYIGSYFLADQLGIALKSTWPSLILLMYSIAYIWYYRQPFHPTRSTSDFLLETAVKWCALMLVASIVLIS